MLATARQKVPLVKLDFQRVKIRKAMTESIILEVPADKEREKAPALVARLTSPASDQERRS